MLGVVESAAGHGRERKESCTTRCVATLNLGVKGGTPAMSHHEVVHQRWCRIVSVDRLKVAGGKAIRLARGSRAMMDLVFGGRHAELFK